MFDEKELRYPKGIKEFKAQTDFRELENGLADAKTNDVVMTITIPKESSRVYAMNLIHWSAAKKMKEIDCEALLGKMHELESRNNEICPQTINHRES